MKNSRHITSMCHVSEEHSNVLTLRNLLSLARIKNSISKYVRNITSLRDLLQLSSSKKSTSAVGHLLMPFYLSHENTKHRDDAMIDSKRKA